MKRTLLASMLVCSAAWADDAATQQQKIASVGYFDVGTCQMAPLPVPPSITKDVLVAELLESRPQLLECLVDPANRGPNKVSKVIIDATPAETGVDAKVTGDNVNPPGIACAEGRLKAFFAAAPTLTAKAQLDPATPITAHFEVQHQTGSVTPSVTWGVNEASDMAGAIRLAEPGWCDCWSMWKDAPHQFKATVKLVKPTGDKLPPTIHASEVTVDPMNDPVSDKVGACVKQKLMTVGFKIPVEDNITVPYSFHLVNSGFRGQLPGATPDLQFLEYDFARSHDSAQIALAANNRTVVAKSYDTLVNTYKAQQDQPKPKKKKGKKGEDAPKITFKDLNDGCQKLLVADDGVTKAFEKFRETTKVTQKFAADLKAAHPEWAKASEAADAKVASADKDVEGAKSARTKDESICPKEHF